MATLTIRWQRLVDESGRTCDRCGTTGQSVEAAYQLLKQSLAPLGFEVELQRIAIDRDAFAKNPIESNRIWIGDDSLEDLLGAKVGQSRCCSVCGESECRTVTVDGGNPRKHHRTAHRQGGLDSCRPQAWRHFFFLRPELRRR